MRITKLLSYRNIRKEIFNSFEEKKEKFTYNGNPLGFDYINEFADALKNRNTYLFEKFEKKILENPSIVDIKNLTNLSRGAMLSIIKKIIPKSAGEESVDIIGLYKCSDQEKILCNNLCVCPKTIDEFGLEF